MVRKLGLICFLILLLSGWSASLAQGELSYKIEGYLLGKEQIPIKGAVWVEVGRKVLYKILLENKSDKELREVIVKAAIPEGTQLIFSSVKPKGEIKVEFSCNGEKYEEYNESNCRAYKVIKWVVPRMAPGERLELQYQVQVTGKGR